MYDDAGTIVESIRGVRVLVVDDEPDLCKGLELIASSVGAETRGVHSAEHALAYLEQASTDIVVTDIRMGAMSGIDLQRTIAQQWPDTYVVMLTGYGTIGMAVDCIRNGAAHFLTKPFDNEEVMQTLLRIGTCVLAKRRANVNEWREDGILVADKKMMDVLQLIEKVSQSSIPVLIEGESGTGKELVARAIHLQSAWSQGELVSVNCAALPDSLLESELFGYRKGAFTGADRDHCGLFTRAHLGTMFLDEVPSMSPLFQAKLLRVLQEHKVRRLGSDAEEEVRFRLIAATNANLAALVDASEFRADLYYRLNGVAISIPPLRERRDDIPVLAVHFLKEAGESCAGYSPAITTEAMNALLRYEWKGNVRELQHTMQRAAVLSMGEDIRPAHLMLDGRDGTAPPQSDTCSYEKAKQEVLDAFQRRFICRVLERTKGNISHAAEECGLTRAAVQKMMRRLDIDKGAFN